MRILVASREREDLDLVKAAVEGRDCDVIFATAMSVALFLAQKNLPELIVSRVSLVDGLGTTLLHELRCDEELRAIPFVFLLREDETVCADARQPDGEGQMSGLFGSTEQFDGLIRLPASRVQVLSVIDPLIRRRLITSIPREPQASE